MTKYQVDVVVWEVVNADDYDNVIYNVEEQNPVFMVNDLKIALLLAHEIAKRTRESLGILKIVPGVEVLK